jgi:hypothetical protein
MALDSVVILLLLFVYFIGTLIYKHYVPKIKGAKGENRVARLLRKLNGNEYKVFNDIYLRSNGRTTQIDHLVVSIYGIFVIETKNYQGWIHGSEHSEYWTQSIYKQKKKFRNPIKQNWAHIYVLRDVLSDYKQLKYYPIIVFAGRGELKNVYSTIPVIYKNQLLPTIRQHRIPYLSIDQVNYIAYKINALKIDEKQGKREHKQYVKQNIYNRKENVKASICPKCGGELKVRKGPYGMFYGCSNFPKCKFTKKYI